jgi:hypothetical protein
MGRAGRTGTDRELARGKREVSNSLRRRGEGSGAYHGGGGRVSVQYSRLGNMAAWSLAQPHRRPWKSAPPQHCNADPGHQVVDPGRQVVDLGCPAGPWI